MEGIGIILAILIVVIISRFVAGNQDENRIKNYIQQRGGQLVSHTWSPFGKGWMNSENSRIYDIVYTDSEGHTRHATVKTSMWGGVYLTEDEIIEKTHQPSAKRTETERLRLENKRLKKELEHLRKR